MNLHPQIIEKKGRKEFVVIPYEEYKALEELMHDYEDLNDLRTAKEESKNMESVPLNKVVSDLELS